MRGKGGIKSVQGFLHGMLSPGHKAILCGLGDFPDVSTGAGCLPIPISKLVVRPLFDFNLYSGVKLDAAYQNCN